MSSVMKLNDILEFIRVRDTEVNRVKWLTELSEYVNRRVVRVY
jgi:hypothetical protein